MSALARWQAFLAQIEARHRQVILEAEEASRLAIASVAMGGDTTPLSNHLSAVKARLQALQQNIVDTWHGKVEDAIFAEGLGVPTRDAAWQQGEDVRHQLDDVTEELEPRVFAELARTQLANAQTHSVACAGCGRDLGAGGARHVEVTCACGRRSVVAPNALLASGIAIATHAIAQEAAVTEWRAMRSAERAMRRVRPPYPLPLIVATEHAQIAYWRAYLAVRAQFEPELGRDPMLELRSRMEQWYVWFAEHEPNWVRAGRPRSI